MLRATPNARGNLSRPISLICDYIVWIDRDSEMKRDHFMTC